MIVIRIVSGPHAGKVRELHDNVHGGVEFDPIELLRQLVQLGSRWQIDYTAASKNEKLDWFRADLSCRVVRALLEGRPVFFEGKRYQAASKEDVGNLTGEIEDAIAGSGHYVTVVSDDEHGVRIGAGQREHPLQ